MSKARASSFGFRGSTEYMRDVTVKVQIQFWPAFRQEFCNNLSFLAVQFGHLQDCVIREMSQVV